MAVVQGQAEPGYEAVRDRLEQQFEKGEHIGAGVSVYHHGRKVVDIWGGLADEDTKRPGSKTRWRSRTRRRRA